MKQLKKITSPEFDYYVNQLIESLKQIDSFEYEQKRTMIIEIYGYDTFFCLQHKAFMLMFGNKE